MNHFQKAQQKGKELVDEKFGGSYLGISATPSRETRERIKSFLDSYAQSIKLAVIEDVMEVIGEMKRKRAYPVTCRKQGRRSSREIQRLQYNGALDDLLSTLTSKDERPN